MRHGLYELHDLAGTNAASKPELPKEEVISGSGVLGHTYTNIAPLHPYQWDHGSQCFRCLGTL